MIVIVVLRTIAPKLQKLVVINKDHLHAFDAASSRLRFKKKHEKSYQY